MNSEEKYRSDNSMASGSHEKTEKNQNNHNNVYSENDSGYNLEEIYKKLQKIGSFTINDSKIYVTLLKIGLASPANISEKSHVDRARVYDSLKRLVKRGIVEEEPVPRAPRYRANPPETVFGYIKDKLRNQIMLASSLEEQLKNIKPESNEQNSVWAIQGIQKITKKFSEMIKNARKFCYIILTLDVSLKGIRELEILEELLLERRFLTPSPEIKIALKVKTDNEMQKQILNRLFHAGIHIYRWDPSSVFPFGLILTESEYIQTFLSSTDPKPKYEFGIIMEKASNDQIKGFKHLCAWVFDMLCKRVVFQKTQKND